MSANRTPLRVNKFVITITSIRLAADVFLLDIAAVLSPVSQKSPLDRGYYIANAMQISISSRSTIILSAANAGVQMSAGRPLISSLV